MYTAAFKTLKIHKLHQFQSDVRSRTLLFCPTKMVSGLKIICGLEYIATKLTRTHKVPNVWKAFEEQCFPFRFHKKPNQLNTEE